MTFRKMLMLAALVQGSVAYNCKSDTPEPSNNRCPAAGDKVTLVGGAPQCEKGGCTLCGLGSSPCTVPPEFVGKVNDLGLKAAGDYNTRVTYFVDGALAWPDLTSSIFSYVPDFAYDYDVTVPESSFPGGKRITFTCPVPRPDRGQSWDGCTAFVYQYRCPGCVFKNGGLPKYMLDNGWEAAHCAPKFKLVPNGIQHPMVTFMKEMGNGESVHFDTSSDTEFLAWHGTRNEVHCGARMTVESCHDTPNHPGICVWDNNKGECKPNFCPRNIGPHLGNAKQCETCTSDEIDSMGNDITTIMVQNNNGEGRR